MLVIDARHDLAAAPRPSLTWPGPVCVVVPAGQDGIAADYADDVTLFDYVSPPTNQMDLLREVIVNAHRSPAQPAGPLLFLSATATAPDQTAAAIAPGDLTWQLDGNGDLVSLVAGARVTEHPMFLTFFAKMSPGINMTEVGQSLNMMKHYLAAS